MIRLRRKQKTPPVTTDESIREVIREELVAHDDIKQAKSEKDKKQQQLRQRLMGMSKAKRRQFIRYLERRKNEK